MTVQNRMTNKKFNRITRRYGKRKAEPKVSGKYITIPELRLRLFLSDSKTLEQWLRMYINKHPEKLEELSKNYNL